ncbi:MAG: cyclic nucleotide-binding domain-containing protein, partial [Candidatus Marinimicrobia bacterium]|nr:cyclic nucleotide-binding domain-containing protein [Candidatus Neomarinimicrobiota bacterium]
KDFHPGDTVCREGDSGEYIYILKKGSLGVYKNDNLVSQYNVPGTILGEMSIILGESRSASIKAITVSTVSVIRLSLMDMVTNFPSFTVKILRTLAERLKDTTEELSLSVVDHHPDDDF